MWVMPLVAAVTLVAVALRRTRWAATSLRVSRWTYGVVMPLSLLYFPIKSGFHVRRVQCEWTFNWSLAIHSLSNYAHLVGFVIFFLVTWAQFPNPKTALWWSLAICLVMGFLIEIAEGATGIHNCRMRDLIPDMTGAAIGALIMIVGRNWRELANHDVA